MAWIVVVPPSARHPQVRFQVCYQEGKRHRSAGIFLTERRAVAEPDPAKAQTLFGEYVMTRWWPAWKDQHPSSEYGTRKKVEKRILPTFGDIPLGDLDASTIGAWKAAMVAEGLTARTVNTYLSLLGTILNAAVDDDCLARPPCCAKAAPAAPPPPATSGPPPRGLAAARAAGPAGRGDRPPLPGAGAGRRPDRDALGRADRPALGRPRFDKPLDDGAVRGSGRLRIARAISDPRRTGRVVEKSPKTEAGKRVTPWTRRRSRRSWPTGSWSAAAL
jgi:hypothetical protein